MDTTWWKKVSDLDSTQREIIELDLDGNYLITGPPGSGKTNVLLLRASYLNSAGLSNCLVITYTRHLREFIASGGKVPKGWVKTFASWARSFLRERGVDLKDLKDLSEPEARSALVSKLEEEIGNMGGSKHLYDSILIDEAQDYDPDEIKLLQKLTPRLYVVGDENQRVFVPSGALTAVRTLGCEEKKLTAHYRMGRKICEVADRLLPGSDLSATCYYGERKLPSEARVHAGDQNFQLRKLVENLKLQIEAYPGQWLGVLAAKWNVLEAVQTYLDANGLSGKYKVQKEGEDRAYDPEFPICIMTIQSAKGGEFRAVHLLAADVFPHFSREKAYTAVTRAKTALDVYHEDSLKAPLQSALAQRKAPKLDLDDE